MSRLGRFERGRFIRVEPESIPEGRVHVLVHGWGRALFRGAEAHVPAWRARRGRESFDPWMREVAGGISARDPEAVILMYDWLDDAATSSSPFAQRAAFSKTQAHGLWLARALDAVLDEGFHRRGGEVHLIGHSFGGRIAAVAAARMSYPPRQLTLLDVPDNWLAGFMGTRSNLTDILRRLPLGTRPGQTFVDNYVSLFGVEYRSLVGSRGVVDVVTDPPFDPLVITGRHGWPAHFYAATVQKPYGLGWSPLLGGSPPSGCFRELRGRMALERACSPGPAKLPAGPPPAPVAATRSSRW